MSPDAFDIIEKLDYIEPLGDGSVELHIAPRPGRLDGSHAMAELLNRKIQFYLDQLNTDGFRAVFQDPGQWGGRVRKKAGGGRTRPVQVSIVIVLLCEENAKLAVIPFVASAREWVEQNNASLVLRDAIPDPGLDGILTPF